MIRDQLLFIHSVFSMCYMVYKYYLYILLNVDMHTIDNNGMDLEMYILPNHHFGLCNVKIL